MLSFIGGPIHGRTFPCRRAPMFVRIVRDSAGKVDILDGLDDHPADDEHIIAVYELGTNHGPVHICRSRGSRGGSGWYAHANYELTERCQLADDALEALRDEEAWVRWVAATAGVSAEMIIASRDAERAGML
jgi:hypothetical protein